MGLTDKYARMMASLLPPGRVWRLIGGSVLSKLLAACADELGRLEARVIDLLDEADPSTADELLPEYEREIDVATDPGAATIHTFFQLSDDVQTSGSPWAAVLEARQTGAAGDALSFSIGFHDGDPYEIEVRDHERCDVTGVAPVWEPAPNNIGVRVMASSVSLPTVADIESAIAARSQLARVSTHDPAPTKTIDMDVMELLVCEARFFGGAAADAARRARVVARLVARQRYRPSDFQIALAPLLGQAAAEVVVLERTHTIAAAMGDVREIFRFFVYRDPAAPGAYSLADAQVLVDKIKPSHTAGHVIESVNFLCDDPHSLCERDILGA
ncbi:MAG: hypothetical protein ACTHU0_11840 [Kofleriaceae bacterium]